MIFGTAIGCCRCGPGGELLACLSRSRGITINRYGCARSATDRNRMLTLIDLKTASRICRKCHGVGTLPATTTVPCLDCAGITPFNLYRCSTCANTGVVEIEVEDVCPTCNGSALAHRIAA